MTTPRGEGRPRRTARTVLKFISIHSNEPAVHPAGVWRVIGRTPGPLQNLYLQPSSALFDDPNSRPRGNGSEHCPRRFRAKVHIVRISNSRVLCLSAEER